MLCAFDLIEHDGEDLHDRPFLDRKGALARLLRGIKAGILLNEHDRWGMALPCSSMLAGLALRASCQRGSTARIDQGRAPAIPQCRGTAGAKREME
jgi:hypothetical protein